MKRIPNEAKSSTRYWPVIVYLALVCIGVPWYWPPDNHASVAGMPGWVIIAIVVSLFASILTAYLLWPAWPEETDFEPEAKRSKQSQQ